MNSVIYSTCTRSCVVLPESAALYSGLYMFFALRGISAAKFHIFCMIVKIIIPSTKVSLDVHINIIMLLRCSRF